MAAGGGGESIDSTFDFVVPVESAPEESAPVESAPVESAPDESALDDEFSPEEFEELYIMDQMHGLSLIWFMLRVGRLVLSGHYEPTDRLRVYHAPQRYLNDLSPQLTQLSYHRSNLMVVCYDDQPFVVCQSSIFNFHFSVSFSSVLRIVGDAINRKDPTYTQCETAILTLSAYVNTHDPNCAFWAEPDSFNEFAPAIRAIRAYVSDNPNNEFDEMLVWYQHQMQLCYLMLDHLTRPSASYSNLPAIARIRRTHRLDWQA